MSLAGRRYLAALVVGCTLASGVVPTAVLAQAGGEIADKRSDLDDLKKRIRELQQEMSRTEANRSGAAKAVADSEREVSRAQRRALQLERERAEAETRLVALEQAQRDVEGRIAARREELAEWLRRHYVNGAADSVAPLLSARSQSACPRRLLSRASRPGQAHPARGDAR